MDADRSPAVERVMTPPLFPFDADFGLKPLSDPMVAELPRDGEADRPCTSCGADERVWWRNDRWKITALRPRVNPVGLFLETVEHLDFEHFDDGIALNPSALLAFRPRMRDRVPRSGTLQGD
jgi:hypothetical protein